MQGLGQREIQGTADEHHNDHMAYTWANISGYFVDIIYSDYRVFDCCIKVFQSAFKLCGVFFCTFVNPMVIQGVNNV